MNRLLLLLAFAAGGLQARAASPMIDLGLFYFTDDFTYSSAASAYKRLMWDVNIGLNLNKKGTWVLGWNYGSYTLTENPGTETSLTITDMGPKVYYYLDKQRTWVTALTYNLITKADYASGSATTELRGTSLKFEAGYMPMMWEGVYMGAKINYYKADFKEEITGQTALAQVTHNRAVIYPTFAMTIRWD